MGVTGLLTMIFSKPVNDLGEWSHSVFDVLLLVKFQKRTGRLLIKDASDEVELFFSNGQLVDLNWLTRPSDKKLSFILVENGHLTKEQVDIAIRRQQDTGNRLGFIIAKMGFMSEPEINGLLTIHVMEVLHKGMDMQSARFVFTDLPPIEIDATMNEILDLQELLLQSTAGSEELPFIDGFIKEAVKEIDENLFLLPAGIIPPNPSEMLGSSRMEFLFSRLQEMYDVLVIDSPPLLPASDALVLAPKVDGVLAVVKAGFLNRDMVGRAIEQLRNAKANLLGVVLNQVDTKREGYYKYYYKYYSKYYGEKG
jgi:capsular exopolysaccharide synthesis family protein